MTQRSQGGAARAGRGRSAAALLAAGVVTIALGGDVLVAGAQDPGSPGGVAEAPFDDVAPSTPSTPVGSTGASTTVPTPATPDDPIDPRPESLPAAPLPASSAAAAAPPTATATTSGALAAPPFAGVAGPVGRRETTLADCLPSEPADRCERARNGSRRTVAPDRGERRDRAPQGALRNAQGVPTVVNPSMSLALPGAVAVGVPNFFIDKFRIPPFLLPIYQAAGIQYGIRWEVLAAINEIETDYGRNLNISSAGALGWMQFMPPTWKAYGTDANRDGRKDPFNPVDAIFAAARYLRAAGADQDLRRAIFAYNRADWYVESVLMRARLIGGLPSDLVGSLSGLTQGNFPVFAKARYADDLTERTVSRRARAGQNVANPVESQATRRGIDIFAEAGAPVIAVQDGTITAVGASKRLGRFVRLRDVYGNTYTYAQLKKIARDVPVPKAKTQSKTSIAKELKLPKRDPKPTLAASAGRPTSTSAVAAETRKAAVELTKPAPKTDTPGKERLFANPTRANAYANGGAQQILDAQSTLAAGTSLKTYFTGVYGLDPEDVVLKALLPGRKVIAGTILGRIGQTNEQISPRLQFEIRPAGRGAPRIDPKPILDGWKLLESTAIYRAQGRNALVGPDANQASIGQILLMSKETLAQRVLSNPRIEVYSCGRRDIEAGLIDRRVLATLEFLAASGLKPTVTSLSCGRSSIYTSSGNLSAHPSGNAVDIAKINGISLLGNQGEGSITDIAVRRLLTLQGTLKPAQIITLMKYEGTDNTLAMADHATHIHVGFRPQLDPRSQAGKLAASILKPSQWIKLIDRLANIDNPVVAVKPSKYAIRVPTPRATKADRGE